MLKEMACLWQMFLLLITVNLATSTSYKEICETFKSASESERMKGILGYSEDELVSSDIISFTLSLF